MIGDGIQYLYSNFDIKDYLKWDSDNGINFVLHFTDFQTEINLGKYKNTNKILIYYLDYI